MNVLGTRAAGVRSPRRGSAAVRELGEMLPAAAIVLAAIVLWQVAVAVFDVKDVILPPPTQIAKTLWEQRSLLASDTLFTLRNVLVGFAVGWIGGVALAAAIVASRVLERALYPLAVGSQTIPVFAIAPLLVIWFGFGMTPKVIITALIVFFPVTVNTVEGLRSADNEMIALMRSLSASRWQIFRIVQIPAALPYVIAGTQVGVAYSVIGAVIGEWVGSTNGIGARMLSANSLLQTDLVFAAIVVLTVMALVLFVLVTLLGRWLTPWRRYVVQVSPKENS